MYMQSTARNTDLGTYARENGFSASDVEMVEATTSKALNTCEHVGPRPTVLPVTTTATRPNRDDYLQSCGPEKPRCRCFADGATPLPPELRQVYFLTMMDPAALQRRVAEAPLSRRQKDQLEAVVIPAMGKCMRL
jgi:hypothetical protein